MSERSITVLRRFQSQQHDIFHVKLQGEEYLLLQTKDQEEIRVWKKSQPISTFELPRQTNTWGIGLDQNEKLQYGEEFWGSLSPRYAEEVKPNFCEPKLNHSLARRAISKYNDSLST